jgi:hypothetical protein
MKALALRFADYLPLSPKCTHLRGHGGLKGTIRQVLEQLPQQHFALKTNRIRVY